MKGDREVGGRVKAGKKNKKKRIRVRNKPKSIFS